MRRLPITLALAAAAIAVSLPLLAGDPLPWPWKAKTPPDPAALERLSAVVETNILLRTTCTATQIDGGHAASVIARTRPTDDPTLSASVVKCN